MLPEFTNCPVCLRSLTQKKLKKSLYLHTSMGTKLLKVNILRCQHSVNGIKCGTTVYFHKYVHNNNQYFYRNQPKYILIGKSHIFEMHYIRYLALQQLLHGNGVKLITIQQKITTQHPLTPNLPSIIQGTCTITPSPTADNIALIIKIWMLLRYIGTHTPQVNNKFPKNWSIEDIIHSIGTQLQHFNLRPHTPSSTYTCNNNIFILDGTCKITFKICSILGCYNGIINNNITCNEHSSLLPSHHTSVYTGMFFFVYMVIYIQFLFIRWCIQHDL